MLTAEFNYEIYDKELLVIINCLETWRSELKFTSISIQIFSDHWGLKYFMIKRTLTCCQTHWAEKLSEYNFKIIYREGKSNQKADALTRQTDSQELEHKHQKQMLLESKHFKITLTDVEDLTIHDQLHQTTQENEVTQKIIEAINNNHHHVKTSQDKISLSDASVKNQLIFLDDCIWIPEPSIAAVIKKAHAQIAADHLKRKKIYLKLHCYFIWNGMTADIAQYIANCHSCRWVKASQDRTFELLQPLPMLEKHWQHVIMNFVTDCPLTAQGNNTILRVTCRLSKKRHFITYHSEEGGTSAEATVWLILKHVWKLHELFESVVSDRGTQSVSDMWTCLCKILGIQHKLSTVYHPQTDSQSENFNQWMKQHLRIFVNENQNNWDCILSMTEFAANDADSVTTGMSPFFVNKGFDPTMSFSHNYDMVGVNPCQHQEISKAESISHCMNNILTCCCHHMAQAQEAQAVQTNHHCEDVTFAVNDLVWVNGRNLYSECLSKKLNHCMYEPFKVVSTHNNAYEL